MVSVGSVSVSVVPSAEEFRAKMDELTRDESVTVKLKVDSSEADVKLAGTKLLSDALGGSLKGGGSGAGSAGGSGLSGAFSSAASGASSLGSALGPLGIAAITLSPLLAPVGGGLVTGAIALGSAFTVAGLAVGGFAAVAMPLLNDATNANQKLLAAQQAVNNAPTSKAREDALLKQQALITQLGAPTIALGNAMNDLQHSWHQFAEGFQPEVLELFQTAASSLAKILPEITPVIAAGAIAVNLVAKEFVAALESPAGQQFFKWVATEAGPIILTFADIFLKFGEGVIGIFEAFTPLTNLFVVGLDNAAASFAKWGTELSGSSGFQQFIEYMKANGPLLLNLLSEIIKFAFDLIVALAPIAPYMIDVLSAIVKAADWLVTGLGPNIKIVILDIVHGFGDLANLIADFVQGVGDGFGHILHGAEDAFGWIPLLKGPLKAAAADFDSFRDTAVADLHAVAAAAAGFGAIASLSLGSAGVQGRGLGALASGSSSSSSFAPNTSNSLSSMFAQFNSLFSNFKLGTGSAPSDLTGPSGGLPLTPGAGVTAAATAAANNAAGIASLLGLNLMQSLASGIVTGTNPLTQAFTNINLKLTGPAQTLGTALEAVFTSALAYGQAAAKSLAFNITGANTVGTQSLAHVTGPGQVTLTPQSQLVGNSFNALVTDQKFVADITKAKTLGLSTELLGQFVTQGPSSLPVLDALVNSGASAIAQLNQNNSAIDALGNTYGIQTSSDKYLPQINTNLQKIVALQEVAPVAHAVATGGVLNHTAAHAQLKAATTPSKGVFARAQ